MSIDIKPEQSEFDVNLADVQSIHFRLTKALRNRHRQTFSFTGDVTAAIVQLHGVSFDYGNTDHHVKSIVAQAHGEISGNTVTVIADIEMKDDSNHVAESHLFASVIAAVA